MVEKDAIETIRGAKEFHRSVDLPRSYPKHNARTG